MTDIPSISFRVLIRKVKQMGFEDVRQKGSHIRFVHPDGRRTTIPDHGSRDVPQGLLIKIVHYDLKMDLHEFFKDG